MYSIKSVVSDYAGLNVTCSFFFLEVLFFLLHDLDQQFVNNLCY